jgi:hypothetical protein
MSISIRWHREHASETRAIEHERRGRELRNVVHRPGPQAVGEKILQALIDRTKMAGERAILFAAEGEKVID